MAGGKVTFKVEGLNESIEALKELRESLSVSNATARNTIKRALVYSLEPIAEDASRMAPKRIGTLQTSIVASTTLTKRQRGEHTKTAPIEAFVGAGPLPHAHMVEFGSAHNAPQPFLRPAVDRNVAEVFKRFADQLKIEIEKTAARAERKLAKLLAKGTK
jgi:HK97 gp10 family phage protein